MNIRYFSCVIILLIVTCFSYADTRIGYSNGSIGRDNVCRSGAGERQGMAIRLSHEKLQMLKGKQITGVSAVYGSRNTTENKARVFVTTTLGAAAMTEATVTISRAATSWTDATFDNPYTITGEEPELFIGTEMQIATTYQPLSVDLSADNDNTSFVLTNDTWTDTKGMGFGSVNVKAIIGDDVNMTDLLVKTFQLDGYYKANTSYKFSTEMLNFGTTNINSFDVEICMDNATPVKTHYADQNMAPGSTKQIMLPAYQAIADGEGRVTVKVTNINGVSDADMSDNEQNAVVYFYPSNMERGYLIEEFTSQKCVNCPNGQATLNNALSRRSETFVKVLHHSGYQPDAFSMAVDYDYVMFYGSGGTFAPAMMVNRTTCPSAASVPVMNVGAELLTEAMNFVTNQQPYASLKLATNYDEATRELKVAFSLYCHRDMPEGINVINVLLTQDGIVAQQTGGDETYVHHNACRGSIMGNAFGGELPSGTKAGESYTWETIYTLPESIYSDYWEGRKQPSYDVDLPVVVENMRLVGYVAHYDANDINAHNVYNVVETKIGETVTQNSFATDISTVTVAPFRQKEGIYNISGQRVANDYKGLVIENGKVYIKK